MTFCDGIGSRRQSPTVGLPQRILYGTFVVTIGPVHQRLTTQEAADLLGVSRPSLVNLLEAGDIPFERHGRRRRVRLADVISYRQRASTERRAALDRMVQIADGADMYERAATPKRTR